MTLTFYILFSGDVVLLYLTAPEPPITVPDPLFTGGGVTPGNEKSVVPLVGFINAIGAHTISAADLAA